MFAVFAQPHWYRSPIKLLQIDKPLKKATRALCVHGGGLLHLIAPSCARPSMFGHERRV
jgi:hypothetical protein